MTPKEKFIEIFTDMQICLGGIISSEFICSGKEQEDLNKEEAEQRTLFETALKELELEIIERCAQIADPYYSGTAVDYSARRIAEDIRALKEEV